MAIFGNVQNVINLLEQQGKQVVQIAIDEFQTVASWLHQEETVLVAKAQALIAEVESAGHTFESKLEDLKLGIVPELITTLTEGKSAFAVVETDIMTLATTFLSTVKAGVTSVPGAISALAAQITTPPAG